MAEPQDHYNLAWALTIHTTPAIRIATRDLDSDAAVATLGGFYTRHLIGTDTPLRQELSNRFYGVDVGSGIEIKANNADGVLDPSEDYRLVPVTLTHYDLELDSAVVDFTGVIDHIDFANTVATITVLAHDRGILETLLPVAVIDPTPSGPFEKSGSASLPVPVLFGEHVPIRPPSATADVTSDPGGFDFLVAHGRAQIEALYQDTDADVAGLERLGVFDAAPGTPVYVSTTRFSVTGDQSQRYGVRDPIRFKTTASPLSFLVSFVKAYDDGASPHEVEIEDALLDSGMNTVEVGGDWQGIMGYVDITDGLLPVPAGPGASFTAVRLYDPGDASLIVVASSRDWPTATTHISYLIEEILTDDTWGLSARTQQTVDSTSFGVAAVILALAGLQGAVRGALAYDQQPRRAGEVLNELMMMRGMRLGKNADAEWTLKVDTLGSGSRSFSLGPGDYSGAKIKRLLRHGRKPSSQAVRAVTLHWECLGRFLNPVSKFTPREFARTSRKVVGPVGQEVSFYSQWIRDADTAEKVTHYLAEKLKGADEEIEFVAGVEARDVTLGEPITVTVPSDGVTGTWEVYAITKTLTEVTLSCYRENQDAFDAPSGVVTTSAASTEELETRTTTGTGVNLLPNPDFSGPYSEDGEPHFWAEGVSTTITPNASSALVGGTVGGEYIQLVTAVDAAPTPLAWANLRPGIHTLGPLHSTFWSAPGGTVLIASVYCSRTTGLFFAARWFSTISGTTDQLIPLHRDPTDINGNGWARFYGRVRTPEGTTLGGFTIGCSEAGTYLLDGAQVETVERSARKPSRWKRHRALPRTLFATATIVFDGSSSYVATNLIPVAGRVVGVTAHVEDDITLGTATGYNIGTINSPYAWGQNITLLTAGQKTTSSDFTAVNEVLFPNTTSVVVTGEGGTITSGTLRLQLEYTKAAPVSGA